MPGTELQRRSRQGRSVVTRSPSMTEPWQHGPTRWTRGRPSRPRQRAERRTLFDPGCAASPNHDQRVWRGRTVLGPDLHWDATRQRRRDHHSSVRGPPPSGPQMRFTTALKGGALRKIRGGGRTRPRPPQRGGPGRSMKQLPPTAGARRSRWRCPSPMPESGRAVRETSDATRWRPVEDTRTVDRPAAGAALR